MNTFAQRALGFVVTASLALGGLAACGAQAEPDPTNTKELLTRYEANENHQNYHAKLDMDYEISLFGQSIPIDIAMEMDAIDKDGHGTMTMEAMGQKNEMELYTTSEGDNLVQYVRDNSDESATWAKTGTDTAGITSAFTTQDILKDAEFAKTDDGYTLTTTGDKLMGALEKSGTDVTSALNGLGGAEIADFLKDSKVVYTFGKDCLLTGLSFDANLDMSSTANSEDESSLNLNMQMKITINMTLSGYGTIKPEDVAVPEDVKKNAVDTSSLTNEIADLMGNGTEGSSTDQATEGQATEGTGSSDSAAAAEATETKEAA